MFNVQRPSPAPECTKATGYNTKEIVEKLEQMFFGKCYLCEQSRLPDPQIEHFFPHSLDSTKKHDWHNLYLSCSRCNSIKGTKHLNLLDCCDPAVDVDLLIKISLTTYYDEEITIEAASLDADEKTINTVELLKLCYNDKGTPLRAISRTALIEKIAEHHHQILKLRQILTSETSSDSEIHEATSKLSAMLKEKYPFSSAWKWFVRRDSKLLKQFSANLLKDSSGPVECQ